jgi:hypothetical protein
MRTGVARSVVPAGRPVNRVRISLVWLSAGPVAFTLFDLEKPELAGVELLALEEGFTAGVELVRHAGEPNHLTLVTLRGIEPVEVVEAQLLDQSARKTMMQAFVADMLTD